MKNVKNIVIEYSAPYISSITMNMERMEIAKQASKSPN